MLVLRKILNFLSTIVVVSPLPPSLVFVSVLVYDPTLTMQVNRMQRANNGVYCV